MAVVRSKTPREVSTRLQIRFGQGLRVKTPLGGGLSGLDAFPFPHSAVESPSGTRSPGCPNLDGRGIDRLIDETVQTPSLLLYTRPRNLKNKKNARNPLPRRWPAPQLTRGPTSTPLSTSRRCPSPPTEDHRLQFPID